jgi:maltose alpha-D-glucosyltransferase/alpha-amylase
VVDLWFKDAVIYCVDVDTYQDSNGDGVGDFHGLMERLDHITGMGITCIWLLPFYPSPDRDNGFDIIDYYGVDSRLGSLGDFVEFIHKAHERGIRVIVDLVVNHTSDQHPWFQAARRDRNSPYWDYYVWSDEEPENVTEGIVFPGEQENVWTYDEVAKAFYFHHFYEHQPDLNMSNPAVRDEICRIMGYWLQLGVSGFRVDAAPFLVNEPGSNTALREFRELLSWRRGHGILLAEANVSPDEIPDYFADGTQIHMMFGFWLNQHLMLALARKDATPLQKALAELPLPPPSGQYANFLRNHDELDLGRLSDDEREEVYREFGPEEHMQIYDRGLRRRLPPMLAGDRRRIEMAYSLLFSLPGTPVLLYGEEIGMGEDLSLSGRASVRTPMQWSEDPNGGFSTAPQDQLVRPVVSDAQFGFEKVNVRNQNGDPASLLNAIERMIRVRKEVPEFGNGKCSLLKTSSKEVFAHRCDWKNGTVVIVHNLSDRSIQWQPPHEPDTKLVELLGHSRPEIETQGPIELPPYGYLWLRLESAGKKLA